MKRTKNIFFAFAVMLALGVGVAGCSEEFESPDSPSGETIMDIIDANADLDIMAAALVKTGLYASLDNFNSGAYTVFAPHDSAFVAYVKGALAKADPYTEDSVLVFINSKLTATTTGAITLANLTSRLNYHIVSSNISSSLITGKQVFNSLSGGRISLSKQGITVLINANVAGTGAGNGAKVRAVDAVAANGVVHTINKVLSPVTTANVGTTLGISVNYGSNPPVIGGGNTPDAVDTDYDLFAIALRKTGLVTLILPNATPAPDFTVFAPRDLPFRTYLSSLSGTVTNETTAQTYINGLTGADSTALGNLVKYHLVQGRVLTTDFSNDQIVNTMLTGKSFTVHVAGTITLTDVDVVSPDASIVAPNVLTNAGIVHGLNNVLLPE